jgi:DNA-binding NtrC family response regulator
VVAFVGMTERSSDEESFGDLSTVLQYRFDPSPAPDASFRLRLEAGPDSEGEVTIVLDDRSPSRLLVGQSPACDIRLRDPAVSRRHVALELVGAELRVTDLESTNGTFVGAVRVGEAFLRGGEVLRLGGSTFRVEKAAPSNAELPIASRFAWVVGMSREMRRLYPLCERLAQSTIPVIIEGETGTGKEVLARSLHDSGPRADAPFVVFDCTAAPPNLIEAELFGHEKGAFTGALAQRKGVFEQAHGGTLFIDEVGDLDPSLQPKLLRALERSEVRRVGGVGFLQVDVRILAATRRDLDREVQEGRFRDDLFHRLAVGRIELPPLRKRRGDIPILARHFAQELGGAADRLTPDLVARWDAYNWPGNVRELRNAVARHLALGELADLVPSSSGPGSSSADRSGDWIDRVIQKQRPLVEARQDVVGEFERRYLAATLESAGGNVTHAAKIAGIPRRYFQLLRARRGT